MPAFRPARSRVLAADGGLPRRTFLRAAGVSLGLPWLSAMAPALGGRAFGGDGGTPGGVAGEGPPKRFVAMTLKLGLRGENLYPQQAGRGWAPSRYLAPLEDLRDQLTLVSGTSHPDVTGGHRAEAAVLTCNPAGASGRSRNTVSIDQHLARHLGHHTRFPSLVVSTDGSESPCYTAGGAMVPAIDSPRRLFTDLFVDPTPAEREKQAARVAHGRSVMDLVLEDAGRLSREVGAGDRRRLDEYFTGVRELELRMAADESWANTPKPRVDAAVPRDVTEAADLIGKQRLMNSVLKLALETDSTRFAAFHLGGTNRKIPVPGVSDGYHNLSHHGLDEDKLDQLALVEGGIVAAWGDFLRSLAAVHEHGTSLLDSTSVLLTSNLGNASNHSNQNMPVVLAGGGFRHGQHLAFDPKRNAPLPNLFVSVLQQTGLEEDSFFSSTGTLTGLEA